MTAAADDVRVVDNERELRYELWVFLRRHPDETDLVIRDPAVGD